jgi:hypothetical protein
MPMSAATLASGSKLCCAASISFGHRGALIRVHAHKPRRDAKLHHAGLSAHERGDEAGWVHDAKLQWLR